MPSATPSDSRAAAGSRPRRRTVLVAGTAGALALAGCGPVRLGGPAQYTPPPPGIDDLYRTDLLLLLDRAREAAARIREDLGGPAGSEPTVSAELETLRAALPVQRTALLTGAQHEREQESSAEPEPATAPPPEDVPEDLASLVALLVELRDLCADAARQVSGSLARPVGAIGAHTAWIATRLQRASGQGEVPAVPEAAEIEPTRRVPQTDPPSIGARSDFHLTIETAQQEEWYAGYVHEVLAAVGAEDTREAHREASTTHRDRATALGEIAAEESAPVVPRQAVYALPGGTMDERMREQMPSRLAEALLVAHLALVGAAPFARRALPIAAALTEAEVLSGLVHRLGPLPSLEVDAEAVSDGGG